MSIPDRTITKVAWSELFPWICLFKTFSLASSVTVVAFATLGTVVAPVGWIISEKLFLTPALIQSDPFFQELTEANRSPYRGVFEQTRKPVSNVELWGARLNGLRAVFDRLTAPYRALFQVRLGARRFWYLVFGCLWSLGGWSFAGCCISRYAAISLARDERLPINEVWAFGCQRWFNCVLAVVACFLVVGLFCLPCVLIGLLLTGDVSSVIGALLWFIVAACGLGMAVVLIGTLFGWPLMIATVAAENQNALDAVTRAFAYVYQRPLHYALYGLVAVLFGGFCWLIIVTIAQTAINAGFWGASWSANVGNPGRIDDFRRFAEVESSLSVAAETVSGQTDAQLRSRTLEFSTRMIRFWNGMISTLAVSLLYGLFWCEAVAIYLLLRRDVDETEFDEVYVEGDQRVYELPPLKSDEMGVPTIERLEEYRNRKNSEPSQTLDSLGE